MKSQAVRAVFHLVLGLIVLAVMIYILTNVPKKVGAISSFFDTLFGWLSPKASQVDKAILCSFYRCYSGCDNLPDDVANYEINYRGETVKCKDFCRKDLVKIFDTNNDGRICGKESEIFPVEFTPDFGKKGWKEFSTSFLKQTFDCVVVSGIGDLVVKEGSKYAIIHPADFVEKDEECGAQGVRVYKLAIPGNMFEEYFIDSKLMEGVYYTDLRSNPVFKTFKLESGSIHLGDFNFISDKGSFSTEFKSSALRFLGYTENEGESKYFDVGTRFDVSLFCECNGHVSISKSVTLSFTNFSSSTDISLDFSAEDNGIQPTYTVYYGGFAFKDILLSYSTKCYKLRGVPVCKIRNIKVNGSVWFYDCNNFDKEECYMNPSCKWEDDGCQPVYGKVIKSYRLETSNKIDGLYENPFEVGKLRIWDVYCKKSNNDPCGEILVIYNFSYSSSQAASYWSKLFSVNIAKGRTKIIGQGAGGREAGPGIYSITFESYESKSQRIKLKITSFPSIDCNKLRVKANCESIGCKYTEIGGCGYWNRHLDCNEIDYMGVCKAVGCKWNSLYKICTNS